jgi:hypothetical protein
MQSATQVFLLYKNLEKVFRVKAHFWQFVADPIHSEQAALQALHELIPPVVS